MFYFLSIVLSCNTCLSNNYQILSLILMSEQKIQDENGAVTEQNPMVQRISLEVQRREPSSVCIHSLTFKKRHFSLID